MQSRFTIGEVQVRIEEEKRNYLDENVLILYITGIFKGKIIDGLGEYTDSLRIEVQELTDEEVQELTSLIDESGAFNEWLN